MNSTLRPRKPTRRSCRDVESPRSSRLSGLRDDLPLTVYQQTLPHWRQDGATYFVTFRLADSLPQSKLHELRQFKAEWKRQHSPPQTKEDAGWFSRETMQRVERWLDQGIGSCVLKSPEAAASLVDSLHAGDDSRFELGCYVVMPNHVHAIVHPLDAANQQLEMILKSRKASSACEINRQLGRSGTLWQRDNYDRIIRDEEHLYRVIQYIGRNPHLAGLSIDDVRLWIRPSWVECGWNFDEQ